MKTSLFTTSLIGLCTSINTEERGSINIKKEKIVSTTNQESIKARNIIDDTLMSLNKRNQEKRNLLVLADSASVEKTKLWDKIKQLIPCLKKKNDLVPNVNGVLDQNGIQFTLPSEHTPSTDVLDLLEGARWDINDKSCWRMTDQHQAQNLNGDASDTFCEANCKASVAGNGCPFLESCGVHTVRNYDFAINDKYWCFCRDPSTFLHRYIPQGSTTIMSGYICST